MRVRQKLSCLKEGTFLRHDWYKDPPKLSIKLDKKFVTNKENTISLSYKGVNLRGEGDTLNYICILLNFGQNRFLSRRPSRSLSRLSVSILFGPSDC